MKLMRFLLPLVLILLLISPAWGLTLNLKVLWTPNTEPDMSHYNLYRIDGGNRIKINQQPIPFYPGPGTSNYPFSVDIPDSTVTMTLIFVMTAVDTSGNESGDSVPAPYTYGDTTSPVNPKDAKVIKR